MRSSIIDKIIRFKGEFNYIAYGISTYFMIYELDKEKIRAIKLPDHQTFYFTKRIYYYI